MDAATIALILGGGLNVAGGILQGKAQGEMNEQQIRAAIQQAAAQLGMDEAKFTELLRQGQSEQAVSGAQQTPNRVGWRQNQAMAAAIMPGLRNTSVSSNIPGMSQFIPQVSGGLRIPEGGFGPDVQKFFGEKAMLAGEQDLDRNVAEASAGRFHAPSYSSVYGEPGVGAETSAAALSSKLRKESEDRSSERRSQINTALGAALSPTGAPQEKKKGGSVLGKIGKTALRVAFPLGGLFF